MFVRCFVANPLSVASMRPSCIFCSLRVIQVKSTSIDETGNRSGATIPGFCSVNTTFKNLLSFIVGMNEIGFLSGKSSADKESKKEIESLDHLIEYMQKEVDSYSQFENELREQIQHIDHLKQNMQSVLRQFDSVKKLATSREDLVRKLMAERGKPVLQIDVSQCREYIRMIQHIDGELNKAVPKILEVLKRMMVNDLHTITLENKEHQQEARKLDKEARNLLNEVNLLWRKVRAHDGDIQEASQFISKVEGERKKDS